MDPIDIDIFIMLQQVVNWQCLMGVLQVNVSLCPSQLEVICIIDDHVLHLLTWNFDSNTPMFYLCEPIVGWLEYKIPLLTS
jgi:hypothetical protein